MKLDIQKIKLLMRKNKIGQTQLGNSIGRSREWVSKFMNEKLEPKKEIAELMAEKFKVPLSEIQEKLGVMNISIETQTDSIVANTVTISCREMEIQEKLVSTLTDEINVLKEEFKIHLSEKEEWQKERKQMALKINKLEEERNDPKNQKSKSYQIQE